MRSTTIRRHIDAHTDLILSVLQQFPNPMGTRDFARACGKSEIWARILRMSGDGPAFHKLGNKVLYYQHDIAAWLGERRYLRTQYKPESSKRPLKPARRSARQAETRDTKQ